MARAVVPAIAVLLALILGLGPSRAQLAYIPNAHDGTVSVINTPSNMVIGSPITVGGEPEGVAVAPDGSKVYVANSGSNNVSVIAATGGMGTSTIAVGNTPIGVAVTPDGSTVYVANSNSTNVSVIAAASGMVTGIIPVGSGPYGVAVTPDGRTVYVTNQSSNNVSVIATASNTVIATIPVGPVPQGVAVTPDGSKVYVTSQNATRNAGSVSVIAAATNMVTATIPVDGGPAGVAVTPDGSKVYVANTFLFSDSVSVIATATGALIATIPVGVEPWGVAVTPDGSKVYVANASGSTVSVIATATNTVVNSVAVGIDPVAFGNFIGPSIPLLQAAVLPVSRSVEVGRAATAFATIINPGPQNASTCTIAPLGSVPLDFLYQTTDPSTNALTGTANTPVNITAGAAQSFLIAPTPTAPFNAANVNFSFTCANAVAAPTQTGLNTLLLSGSTSPVPDVVALAASGDPGIVDIPGMSGTGAFAVATVNLGADATITASANTGATALPVTLRICQTVPATGACMAPPAASVTADIQPNATPTFGIFATGQGTVPFDPANNRVFVQFADPSGNVRGETSVAVRTQ